MVWHRPNPDRWGGSCGREKGLSDASFVVIAATDVAHRQRRHRSDGPLHRARWDCAEDTADIYVARGVDATQGRLRKREGRDRVGHLRDSPSVGSTSP